jgi:hypothetical protein
MATADSNGTGHVQAHSGRCFCGAVEIEVRGVPLEMGYCHCQACRDFSGAPVSSFILYRAEDVRVTQGSELLARFRSSEMTERRFCPRCGSRVMAEHPAIGATDISPALLPTVEFQPVVHLNYEETVLRIHDGLPKLRDFPQHAGGSGEILAE